MVCGFHAYKEAEKQNVQYSTDLRDPFYHPEAVFLPAPSYNAIPVYLSFVTRGFLFLSEFPFHSFSNDFSDMVIAEYAQDIIRGMCIDRFAYV